MDIYPAPTHTVASAYGLIKKEKKKKSTVGLVFISLILLFIYLSVSYHLAELHLGNMSSTEGQN